MSRTVRRWPLFFIASPAAVAIWSGWVGLGTMCGFGVIHPLPGIWDALRLNTAITLPVGVEAYAAFALGAWLHPGEVPPVARKFARRSSIGALALGMLGQVVYHLLAAAHAHRAPWPVVVLVSCLPVVSLGFGAALAHLLRAPAADPESAPEVQPETASETRPQSAPGDASASAHQVNPRPRPRRNRTRYSSRVSDADAEMHFATDVAAGEVPSARRIQRELHVGQQRARTLREHLASVSARA